MDANGNLGPKLLATAWPGCAIGTAVFAMRIYVCAFIIRRWNAAFWLALASYVSLRSPQPDIENANSDYFR